MQSLLHAVCTITCSRHLPLSWTKSALFIGNCWRGHTSYIPLHMTTVQPESIDDDDSPLDSSLITWIDRIKVSIAKSRKIIGGNYVQIATVDLEGNPTCRTVVFRGFTQSNGAIKLRMITDSRSEKAAHIKINPKCEMVWWFSKSSEQYRISGELELIDESQLGELQNVRQSQWKEISDSAREQFYWMFPGQEFESSEAGVVPPGGRDQENKILPPPPNFSILFLNPSRVKYLCLRNNYTQVDTLQGEEGADGDVLTSMWKMVRVNP